MAEDALNIICLDAHAATARMLIRARFPDEKKLPSNCGGLRFGGYYKASHAGTPLISIILPVFNGGKTVGDAIRSVVTQNYPNVELIIVDGGSTDNTLAVIKDNEHHIDIWTSETDNGAYDAMNKGLALASGDWLYFLGCDDVMQNCLHRIAPFCTGSRNIYYGDVYMPGKHAMYGGMFSIRKLLRRNICHQAIFYPRGLFMRYQYDQRYPVAADYFLNLYAFSDHDFQSVYVPVLVATFNDTNGISSTQRDTQFERDVAAIIKSRFSPFLYMEFLIRSALKRFEQHYIRNFVRNARTLFN